MFIGLFTVIRFGILSYQELLEEKLRAEKSNALLRQAQLQRLTQQMQPHFLFNALNTVSSLMHTDVERADATLIRLADVLRATLDVSELHEAPLSTELRLVRGYAQVMQERYSDRVDIAWRIDDAALDCMLPVMSIQPLLENIFKHTVERRREPTRIVVSVAREAGRLTRHARRRQRRAGRRQRARHRPEEPARAAGGAVRRARQPGLVATRAGRRARADGAAVRVLIVDDEQPARDKLRRMLEQDGGISAIDEARDGVEALQRIAEFRPDACLLRHPDAGSERPRTGGVAAGAGAADRVRDGVRPVRHQRVRRQRDRLPAQAVRPGAPATRDGAAARAAAGAPRPRAAASATAMPVRQLLVTERGVTRVVRVEQIGWIETADNYVVLHCPDAIR